MSNHAFAALGQRHAIHDWEVADAAALAALTPTADDVGKIAWQQDDDSFWFLTDEAGPTWEQLNGGGGAVSSVNGQTGVVVLDADDIDDTSTTNKFATAAELTKLSGIEAGADVTDSTNVDAAGATMNSDTTLAGNGYFLDEDTMTSDSATKVPSQQSVKAYVDAAVSGATIPDASDTVKGKVELATTAETTTGTDATRAVTPDGLHDMTSLAGAAWFLDEDTMTSNSDTKVPSQQSVKAYVDSQVSGGGYSDEQAQDAIAAAIAAGTQTGILVTYTDASNKFDFTVTGVGQQVALTWTLAEGGVPIVGSKTPILVPFAHTIKRWYLMADISGDLTLDVWRDAYASYPPTNGDSIVAAANPALSSADHGSDSTLTGWSTTGAANDVYNIEVEAAATITQVTFAMIVERT